MGRGADGPSALLATRQLCLPPRTAELMVGFQRHFQSAADLGQ